MLIQRRNSFFDCKNTFYPVRNLLAQLYHCSNFLVTVWNRGLSRQWLCRIALLSSRMWCGLLEICWHFFYLQGYFGEGSTTCFWRVGKSLSDCTRSHPERLYSFSLTSGHNSQRIFRDKVEPTRYNKQHRLFPNCATRSSRFRKSFPKIFTSLIMNFNFAEFSNK